MRKREITKIEENIKKEGERNARKIGQSRSLKKWSNNNNASVRALHRISHPLHSLRPIHRPWHLRQSLRSPRGARKSRRWTKAPSRGS